MKKLIKILLILTLPIVCYAQTYAAERVFDGGRDLFDLAQKFPTDELTVDTYERDSYGRILAYVWIDEKISTKYGVSTYEGECPRYRITKNLDASTVSYSYQVNATLIKCGYATPMTIPPNVKYADLFKALYDEARGQKRGVKK